MTQVTFNTPGGAVDQELLAMVGFRNGLVDAQGNARSATLAEFKKYVADRIITDLRDYRSRATPAADPVFT